MNLNISSQDLWTSLNISLNMFATTSLRHWGQDEMADMLADDIFKLLDFDANFTEVISMFVVVQLTIIQHWFRWWLGVDQATSHYLNQSWLDYRCIVASFGLNELRVSGEASLTWAGADMTGCRYDLKSLNARHATNLLPWYHVSPYSDSRWWNICGFRWIYFNGKTSSKGVLSGAHHWSPISLVPHLIGPPSHWSPN